MQNSPVRTLFAAAILFAAAPGASAASITLLFDNSSGTSSVPVQFTANGTTSSTNVNPAPYYWHTVGTVGSDTGFTSGSVATFCIELNQSILAGNSYTYQINTNLASMPTIGSSVKANQIEELYGLHYNTAWANTSFSGSLQSTAFQLALWELVYDGPGSLNLTSGNFQSNSGSVSNPGTATGLAAEWLTSLSPTGSNASAFSSRFSGYDLVGLSNANNQDQIVLLPPPPGPKGSPAVPAPPGVILAGLGFIGLLGRARYLRGTA